MPQLPFDPAQLSTAFPDVIAAVGIALVLAIVTFRRPPAPSIQEALAAMAERDESDS
jgi:hypothetical protein